ncbi:MAG TPA: hypothetical protein PLL66_09590, partial [Bacteroidales bacterium]|nr:hypothetical protein [Bacteroidales bacterium]
MTNKDEILKQDSVNYLKSKRVCKKAQLFITNEELVLESNTTSINGMRFINSALNLFSVKKTKKIIIPIDSIKAINFDPQENIIEFIDNKDKDFRIEFKKTEDWITLINS